MDCTTEGKELCETHGVRGFPTIKYGDPTALEDYAGGRSYEELKQFADENLGPSCGPTNLDLCSDDVRAKIEKYLKMSSGRLEAKIRNLEKVLAEDVPLMKKTLASIRSGQGDAKSEL